MNWYIVDGDYKGSDIKHTSFKKARFRALLIRSGIEHLDKIEPGLYKVPTINVYVMDEKHYKKEKGYGFYKW